MLEILPIIILNFLLSAAHPHLACRCMPTETCWPSLEDWDGLNRTLGGKLVATRPLALPCHVPSFNDSECQMLQSQWTDPFLHDDSSSSIMAPAVANQTCDPFTASKEPCTLGNMVVYSVNATEPSDFSSTIAFVKDRNIRLVIRNTGHDYSGKSTGAGALSIWTHNMKSIQPLNYTSPHYHGPAVNIGAGVQVWEAYNATNKRGQVMVAGDCATVGAAGGYTQGGGHSVLSSKFGLGADQALEWEVVDGQGRILKASRTENSDLFWALGGGGGGTYAVVSSLTLKTYPDFPVTGVVLRFEAAGEDVNASNRFYDAVGHYHSLLPGYAELGGVSIAKVTNTSFLLTPLTFPDMRADEAARIMQPFFEYLDDRGIRYEKNITESEDFLGHYNKLIEPNPTQLVQNAQYGGRFIPRAVVDDRNGELTDAVRRITEDGAVFVGIGLNVSSVVGEDIYNSVHPSWRQSVMSVILTSPWPNGANLSDMAVNARKMTEKWVPSLAAITPGAGCYLSESDPRESDWKESFYGSNYEKLYAIKNKYDPHHIYYGNTSVGSEDWEVQANGGLCYVGGK